MTPLFAGLFDDAALFPPGDAPMAAAVPAHRELRTTLGDLTGPFVVPAGRLGELAACLGDGPPLEISLIASATDLPGATTLVSRHPGLRLAAVEVPVVAGADAAQAALRALPEGVPAAVEIPRTGARDEVLDVLAGSPHRAKVRTGGLRRDLFPSPEELAGTLYAAVTRGVAVKCTAGLHNAIRHVDTVTGFAHHGFLNVLSAAAALADGVPEKEAVARLSETGAMVVADELRGWPAERGAAARAIFTSFGTCSVREPVDDLIALGLLERRAR